MTIPRKNQPSVFAYSVGGSEVHRSTSHKYLGVTISTDLRWNQHVDNIKKRASRTLGVVRRTLTSCSQEVKARAYLALVRPGLEYASAAWNPHTQSNVKILEQVQRRAARVACRDYSRHTSATGLVQRLGWPTLEERRHLNQLVMYYKIQHSLVAIPFPPCVQPLQSVTRASHPYRYHHLYARTEPRRNSFFVSIIPAWNVLPLAAVVAFRAAALPHLNADYARYA